MDVCFIQRLRCRLPKKKMSLVILHVRARACARARAAETGNLRLPSVSVFRKKIASLFETRTEPENLLLYTGLVVHQRLLL